MKKFEEIAKLTKSFLDGDLQRLVMEYVEPEVFKIHILYEDNYDFFYDYDLEVNLKNSEYSFLGHSTSGPLFRSSLIREQRFERAIYDTIANS